MAAVQVAETVAEEIFESAFSEVSDIVAHPPPAQSGVLGWIGVVLGMIMGKNFL